MDTFVKTFQNLTNLLDVSSLYRYLLASKGSFSHVDTDSDIVKQSEQLGIFFLINAMIVF